MGSYSTLTAQHRMSCTECRRMRSSSRILSQYTTVRYVQFAQHSLLTRHCVNCKEYSYRGNVRVYKVECLTLYSLFPERRSITARGLHADARDRRGV